MRKLFLFLALATSACPQGGNTVFQVPFNATTMTGVSGVMHNIGQQYHLLTVRLTSANSCTTGAVGLIQIQASYDNINYFSVGAPIISVVGGYAATSASGAYGYIRINYTNQFNGSGPCTMTANYAGSITGTLSGSSPFTASQDSFLYASGAITSTTPLLVHTCQLPTLPQVYMYYVTDPGGANSVSIYDADTVTALTVAFNFKTALPVNGSFGFPQGTRPYLSTNTGISVSVVNAVGLYVAATAGTEIDYTLAFRCE
jgi:hypothetical protein